MKFSGVNIECQKLNAFTRCSRCRRHHRHRRRHFSEPNRFRVQAKYPEFNAIICVARRIHKKVFQLWIS